MYDLFINKNASNVGHRLDGEATKVGVHVARMHQPWLKAKRKARARRQNAACRTASMRHPCGPAAVKYRPGHEETRFPIEVAPRCTECRGILADCRAVISPCAAPQCAAPRCGGCATNQDQATVSMDEPKGHLVLYGGSISTTVSLTYGSSNQLRSLSFYRQRTGPMISMSGPVKDFWTIIIPQASWTSSPVKLMLCTLSLLDRSLVSSQSAMYARSDYCDALKCHNQAIMTFRRTQHPSLSDAILFSIMAHCFDIITNNYERALVHARATNALMIEAKQPGRRLTLDDQFVLDRAALICRQGAPFCHNYSKRVAPNRCFSDLDDCRKNLHQVLRNLAPVRNAVGVNFDAVRNDLCTWRTDFEQYRYAGLEPLQEKRTLFLAHNCVGTYLDLMDPVQSESPSTRIFNCILVLNDVDHILEEHDGLQDLHWILLVVLHAINDIGAENDAADGWQDILSRCRRSMYTLECSFRQARKRHSSPQEFSLPLEDEILQIHRDLRRVQHRQRDLENAKSGNSIAWVYGSDNS